MNEIIFLLIDRQSLYKGYPSPTLHSYCKKAGNFEL